MPYHRKKFDKIGVPNHTHDLRPFARMDRLSSRAWRHFVDDVDRKLGRRASAMADCSRLPVSSVCVKRWELAPGRFL